MHGQQNIKIKGVLLDVKYTMVFLLYKTFYRPMDI